MARHRDIELLPTVSMHGPEAFEAVFGDPGRAAELRSALTALVAEDGAITGLHLDVEVFDSASPGARDGLAAFVVNLRRSPDRLFEL